MNEKAMFVAVAAVAVAVFLGFLLLFLPIIRQWVQCFLVGVPTSVVELIALRLRRSPSDLIVKTAIILKMRGIAMRLAHIEAAYLAHGGEAITPAELADLIEKASSTTKSQGNPS